METQLFPQYPVPVAKTVLPNGLTVLTAETGSAFVDVRLVFRTGGVDDGQHSGIAHLLEHVVCSDGTREKHPLIQKLRGKILNWGATTATLTTEYQFAAPVILLEEMVCVVFGLCFGRTFSEAAVEAERQSVLAEYLKSRTAIMIDQTITTLQFGSESIWSSQNAIGTEEGIRSFDSVSVNERYLRDYVPANAALVVSGGITHENVLHLVQKNVPTVRSGARRSIPDPPVLRTGVALHRFPSRGFTPAVGVVWRTFESVPGPSPRSMLLSEFLAGSDRGRIYQRLRNELGLVYAVHASSSRNEQTCTLKTSISPEHFDLVVSVINEELERFVRAGITVEEWTEYRQEIDLSRLYRSESHESKRSWKHWRSALVDAWLDDEYFYLKPSDPYPVTRDMIIDAGRKLLDAPKLVLKLEPET